MDINDSPTWERGMNKKKWQRCIGEIYGVAHILCDGDRW